VCRTEKAIASPGQLLRPQTVDVTSVVQPLDARRHAEPEHATRENRAGTAPHQVAAFVALVRCDQLRQPHEIGPGRSEPLQHEPDTRLAHPETALGVLVRKIWLSLDRTLQIRDIVPP